MFDSISLQPSRNITEIKKYFVVHDERKKCRVNYNQANALIARNALNAPLDKV